MTFTRSGEYRRLVDYLGRFIPADVFSQALSHVSQKKISECSRFNDVVQGSVAEAEHVCSAQVRILSAREFYPTCSCSVPPGMWCSHAAALMLHAFELGFLSRGSGFGAAAAKDTVTTPKLSHLVAALESTLGSRTPEEQETVLFTPAVKLLLSIDDDRLGVQVYFDNEIQTSAILNELRRPSTRTLDSILLDLLDEHGVWDESRQRWFLNTGTGIGMLLGIFKEFQSVTFEGRDSLARVEHDSAEPSLDVEWHESGVELSLRWSVPGALPRPADAVLGDGPCWVALGDVFHPVRESATILARFFHTPQLRFAKRDAGTLVDWLERESANLPRGSLVVRHGDLQPEAVRSIPSKKLLLETRDQEGDHFGGTGSSFVVIASLEFVYPTLPSDKNVVFLPDRNEETQALRVVEGFGFRRLASEGLQFEGSHEIVLDLMSADKPFPENWKIEGLSEIKKKVRFSELQLSVQVASNVDEDAVNPSDYEAHIGLLLNRARIPISSLFKRVSDDSSRWVRLENGSYARVPGGSVGRLKSLLGLVDTNYKLSNTIRARLSTSQALWLSKAGGYGVRVDGEQSLKVLGDRLESFKGIKELDGGKSFEGSLRPYQGQGVGWLDFLRDYNLGGILADEMGLGKTIQTLAYLNNLREKKKIPRGKPSLIVAPTSVITNWWYEAKKFTPELKVLLLHGPDRRKHFSSLRDYHLVLTSYALLRIDKPFLESTQFHYIILDEAQFIKNVQTATSLAAKSLRSQYRLALSGTPTENRPAELWSIFDFLMPGFLGTYDFFRTYFEKPIMEQGTGHEAVKLLRERTRPFMLRRTKAEVEKDLPPKIESEVHVEMTESQRGIYSQILAEVRPKVFDAVSKKGVRGASISILAALLRLRQVCNHPNSIESLKNLEGFTSGKFDRFKELVDEALESGRKILVFCQFREMLRIMREELELKGHKYLYLDGSVKERQPLIDQFNADTTVRVFLISLKAGGFGLNLTAADTVIIYDPWWNPAVENQAVDRAHRIGQTKTVSVYRLITEDSIEQKILDLKGRKNTLIKALVEDEAGKVLQLTKTDLESLFAPLPGAN